MINRYNLKPYCLSSYGVQLVRFRNSYRFEARGGKQESSFGYLVHGSGSFFTDTRRIDMQEGELVFIPEGTRYHSLWSGKPDIEYYCLHVSFRTENGSRLEQGWDLQCFSPPGSLDCNTFFARQLLLASSRETGDALEAMTDFYRFVSLCAPLMRPASHPVCSPGVRRALAYIEQHYSESFSIDQLARACFLSPSHLFHLFRDELHITPVDYKNELRVRRALELLSNSSLPIETISHDLGFNSPGYFRRTFSAVTGLTPSEYRKRFSAL